MAREVFVMQIVDQSMKFYTLNNKCDTERSGVSPSARARGRVGWGLLTLGAESSAG